MNKNDAINALIKAAKQAIEDDGGTKYESDQDECGCHACCGTVSYKEHDADCWVLKMKFAMAKIKEIK